MGEHKRKAPRIDPIEAIDITLVSEGPHRGWVRTTGMAKHGLPELEMRHIPLFLFGAAGSMLNTLAGAMLNREHDIKEGESVHFNDLCVFRVVASRPFEDASEMTEGDNAILAATPHWRISDDPMEGMCTLCNSGKGRCKHTRTS